MIFLVIWGVYFGWLGLFAWMAWRAKLRVLLCLGLTMTIIYLVMGWPELLRLTPADKPHYDLGTEIFRFFGAAILMLPLVIAAIVYPIGRLWAR